MRVGGAVSGAILGSVVPGGGTLAGGAIGSGEYRRREAGAVE